MTLETITEATAPDDLIGICPICDTSVYLDAEWTFTRRADGITRTVLNADPHTHACQPKETR